MIGKKENSIKLAEINGKTLKFIITYIYTCEGEIDDCNVSAVNAAAFALGVKSLQRACAEFYVKNLTEDNCFECLSAGYEFNCDNLKSIAYAFIGERWTGMLEFGRLDLIYLKEMLTKKMFDDTDEAVLGRLIDWVLQNGFDDTSETAKELFILIDLDSVSCDVSIFTSNC